jgi:hypothetical protein
LKFEAWFIIPYCLLKTVSYDSFVGIGSAAAELAITKINWRAEEKADGTG